MSKRVILCLLCLLPAALAWSGEVAVSYVKSLGVLSPSGTPLHSAMGNLAVDEEGNLFCGTPGGGSALSKISPDGAIIWQRFHNIPGFQGVAIDKEFVYTCGAGFYGYRQLQRWNRASGVPAPGWQFEWKDKDTVVNGLKPFVSPVSLAVDDQYLYIIDHGGDELRRVDKATGAEHPFAMPVKVVKPVDLAWAKSGNLLLLTESSLIELAKDGTPVHLPLVKELKGAVSVAVQPNTGNIFVAQGGTAQELLNRVYGYTPAGQPIEEIEIGAGGDYQGKWSARAFAFAGGSGDLAFDPTGALWVNPGYKHHQWLFQTLTRFTPGEFKPDRTLSGLTGAGGYYETGFLAVDDQLSIYPHGKLKITWDNKVQWTSGLTQSGDSASYPVTVWTWPTVPAWHAGKLAVGVYHGNQLYTLSPERGTKSKSLAPVLPEGYSWLIGVGPDLFVVRATDGALLKGNFDLEGGFQPVFTPPADAQVKGAVAAVSPDLAQIVYAYAGKLVCFGKDGNKLWEAKAGVAQLAIDQGMVFLQNPDGPGILARDLQTGEVLITIADKPVEHRPAVLRASGLAVGSKDGKHYLFVNYAGRVLVYRVERDLEE